MGGGSETARVLGDRILQKHALLPAATTSKLSPPINRPVPPSSLPLRSSSPMAPIADFLASVIPWSLPPHLQGYVVGKTPLSTPQQVFPTLAGYLVVVFGLRAYMKNRPPLKLQGLFQLHNIILSAGSLLLLSCMAEEIAPLYWKHGLFWAMCNEGMWNKVSFFCILRVASVF